MASTFSMNQMWHQPNHNNYRRHLNGNIQSSQIIDSVNTTWKQRGIYYTERTNDLPSTPNSPNTKKQTLGYGIIQLLISYLTLDSHMYKNFLISQSSAKFCQEITRRDNYWSIMWPLFNLIDSLIFQMINSITKAKMSPNHSF